jgi:hypothetical protein
VNGILALGLHAVAVGELCVAAADEVSGRLGFQRAV